MLCFREVPGKCLRAATIFVMLQLGVARKKVRTGAMIAMFQARVAGK